MSPRSRRRSRTTPSPAPCSDRAAGARTPRAGRCIDAGESFMRPSCLMSFVVLAAGLVAISHAEPILPPAMRR